MSAPTVTPYGALSARKLIGLARKISEAPMASNAESLGRRAGVPSYEFGKLAWHLVDAGLLPPGHPVIIDALGRAAHEQPAARLIAAAARLAPVPPPSRGPSSGTTCSTTAPSSPTWRRARPTPSSGSSRRTPRSASSPTCAPT